MTSTFDKALQVAQDKYPHNINYYEEYKDYYVFCLNDGEEHIGGTHSPIVIRKSDLEALNYEPIFFNFSDEAEDVGDVIKEGFI